MNINNYEVPEWIYNYHWIVFQYNIMNSIQGRGHAEYITGVPFPFVNIKHTHNLIFKI